MILGTFPADPSLCSRSPFQPRILWPHSKKLCRTTTEIKKQTRTHTLQNRSKNERGSGIFACVVDDSHNHGQDASLFVNFVCNPQCFRPGMLGSKCSHITVYRINRKEWDDWSETADQEWDRTAANMGQTSSSPENTGSKMWSFKQDHAMIKLFSLVWIIKCDRTQGCTIATTSDSCMCLFGEWYSINTVSTF